MVVEEDRGVIHRRETQCRDTKLENGGRREKGKFKLFALVMVHGRQQGESLLTGYSRAWPVNDATCNKQACGYHDN